jgi:hypothetical protein
MTATSCGKHSRLRRTLRSVSQIGRELHFRTLNLPVNNIAATRRSIGSP